MQITFTRSIAWAHRGVEIVHYAAGQTIDTDDAELASVALREGWAQAPGSAAASAASAESAESAPATPARAPRKRSVA